MVPRMAPGLLAVHLQLLLQLFAQLLGGTVQDELIPGELWSEQTERDGGREAEVQPEQRRSETSQPRWSISIPGKGQTVMVSK